MNGINGIEVRDICKRHGRTAVLSGVSFCVQKGAICGFIGKNGAGKTTLMRILTDLQRPDSGKYALLGMDSTDLGLNRRRIGAIVESPALYPDMTAEENMRQLLRVRGVYSFESIPDILHMVGLEDAGRKKVKNFSLGMKQKLGLAMALAGDPEIMILDEPMNGLDPQGMRRLRELILKLNREKGVTFLISSHILEELSKIATHYIFIDRGRIIREMTAEELDNECRRSVHIVVSDQAQAEAVLREMNMEYGVVQPGKLSVIPETGIADMIIRLKEHGCDVLRCCEQDENLEEFFINMVEGCV